MPCERTQPDKCLCRAGRSELGIGACFGGRKIPGSVTHHHPLNMLPTIRVYQLERKLVMPKMVPDLFKYSLRRFMGLSAIYKKV